MGRVELALEPVVRKTSSLWNELIDRYHYLGYRRMGGAQMRFFVCTEGELVTLLGFSAAAWRLAPRDDFNGWTESQRKRHLHLVVDNSCFLILPWIKIPNLASHILGAIARQVPRDWEARYGRRPVLLETFVEQDRFRSTSYRASNWIEIGTTVGSSLHGKEKNKLQTTKAVFSQPLHRRFREMLCQTPPVD